MDQVHIVNALHTYKLQPGDGTVYRFGFFLPDQLIPTATNVQYESHTSKTSILGNWPEYLTPGTEKPATARNAFSGVGDGSAYIYFFIDCGEYCGYTWLPRLHHNEIHLHTVLEVKEHMPRVDTYTIIAVLHALSVLIFNPYEIQGAMLAMLKAPVLQEQISERMKEIERQKDEDEDEAYDDEQED